MLKIGDFNSLKAIKKVEFGMYLDDGAGGEILLPKKYVPEWLKPDEMIKVFVYKDSEDRKVATTIVPLAKVGDIRTLRVKDMSKYGAFLDWGLEKDLMLPFSEYDMELKVNEGVLVMLVLDSVTDRIFATTKFNKYLEKNDIDLTKEQEVELIVYKITKLGASVIVNQRYSGLIFENEIYKEMAVGDVITGYVKNIREDGKVDVTLRKKGYDEIVDAKEKIVRKIEENRGFLNLTDDSTPEAIKEVLGMSKKTFKKAVGGLYKERVIEMVKTGIKLVKKER